MNDLQKLKHRMKDAMQPRWLDRLDERQRGLVANCKLYAANNPAGMPGHNLAVLVAKMADLLNEYEEPIKGERA